MDKYLKVNDLISKDACEILAGALMSLEKLQYASDKLVPESFAKYGYSATDALMYYLRPKIEEIVGRPLLPVTSYSRVYRNGAILFEHTDRPACELSVTLNLKNDGVPWAIFMDGVPVFLDQGDGAIYRGIEVLHKRDAFEGNLHVQVFLHYVFADGDNTEWKYDKRLDKYDPF